MSEEIRTKSATGGEKGVKPERHSLIPREGLDAIARVFGFGAQKYADHNWRKGYEWSKSYDALVRHITAFWSGETIDPESGLPHLAHAGFHILVLLTWMETQGEGGQYDDRYMGPGGAVTFRLTPGAGPQREYDFSREEPAEDGYPEPDSPKWSTENLRVAGPLRMPEPPTLSLAPGALDALSEKVTEVFEAVSEALRPLVVNIHHEGLVEETPETATIANAILEEMQKARRDRDSKRPR